MLDGRQTEKDQIFAKKLNLKVTGAAGGNKGGLADVIETQLPSVLGSKADVQTTRAALTTH